jgi:hypothetical protein
MKTYTLPRQALRTTHTPAICDSGAPNLGTRANTDLAGSTTVIKAVHVRGPLATLPSVLVASSTGAGHE